MFQYDPCQGIRNSAENFWGRSKSKWESCLYMLIFPSHAMHAQQVAISWVDWDDTVGTFTVNFDKFCTWAQFKNLLDDILDFDIC